MAVFYKDGKRITFGTSKNNKTKFIAKQNKDTSNALERDGITFGNVTNAGKKAIEENTLDSYIPETEEEKKTIENYNLYLKSPTTAKASYETAKVFADVVKNTPTTKKEETSTTNKETTPVTGTTPVVDTNKGTTDNTTYKGESVLKDTLRKPTKFGIKPVSQLGTIGANTKKFAVEEKKHEKDMYNIYSMIATPTSELEAKKKEAESISLRKESAKKIMDLESLVTVAWSKYGEQYGTKSREEAPRAYEEIEKAQKNLDEALANSGFSSVHEAESFYYSIPNDFDNSVAYITYDGKKVTWDEIIRESKIYQTENSVKNANDFAENSKYTRKKVEYTWADDMNDNPYASDYYAHLYNFINGDETANTFEKNNRILSYWYIPTGNEQNAFLTKEQISIFNYLYEESPQKAIEYLDLLDPELRTKYNTYLEEKAVKEAQDNPISSSVLTVLKSPVDNIVSATASLSSLLGDDEIAEAINTQPKKSQTIRSTVEKNIDNPVGRFLYRNGLNIADNVVALAVGGGSKLGTMTTMASGAYGNTVLTAKAQGLSNLQAFALGFVAGSAEVFFESKSFDALFDNGKLKKNVIEYLVTNAKTEVTGELATEFTNDFFNALIALNKSDIWKATEKHMKDEGMSYEDAIMETLYDYAFKYADVGASALFSATVMSGTPVLANYTVAKATQSSTIGKEVRKFFDENYGKDVTNDYIKATLNFYPPESNAYKLAEEAQNKIDAGKTVSDKLLGKIHLAWLEHNAQKAETKTDDTTNAKTEDVASESTPETTPVQPTQTPTAQSTTQTPTAQAPVTQAQAPTQTSVAQTPSVETTTTPVAQTTTETPTQEAMPVKVGETYTDTKTGDTIKVVERDDTTTTLEMTDKDGNVATQEFGNNQVDIMSTNPRYAKANVVERTAPQTPVEETVESNTVAYNETVDNTVPTDTASTVKSVSVGDTFADSKYGNTITVVDRNDNHTIIAIDNGKKVTTRQYTNEQADKLIADSRYVPVATETPTPVTKVAETPIATETESVTSETNTDVTEVNNSSEVFSRGADGDLRFNQLSIDYADTTMRKGQFRILHFKRQNSTYETVNGYLQGKFGIFKDESTKTYNIIELQSGLKLEGLKTLTEAQKAVEYLNDNTSISDFSFHKGLSGDLYVRTTDEYKAFVSDIKRIFGNKEYANDVDTVTEIKDGKVPFNTKTGLIEYVKTHKGDKVKVSFDNGFSEVRTLESISQTTLRTKKADGSLVSTELKGIKFNGTGFSIEYVTGASATFDFVNVSDTSVETKSIVENTENSAEVLNNPNESAMVDTTETESTPVKETATKTTSPSVGDVYTSVDGKTTVKIADRNATQTTFEITTGTNTTTKVHSNTVADNILKNNGYTLTSQASQNAPKSSETDSEIETTPTPTQNANTERSVSETEATKVTTKKPKTEKPVKSTKKEVKAKTVETTVRLDDFGEKIGGARKDQWSSRGLFTDDLDEMNEREREKNVKKDNVWKRPNYQKLIEAGGDRGLLWAVNEIRKSLNQNIYYGHKATEETKSEKQKVFIETIREIQSMAESAKTQADFEAMGEKWLVDNGYLNESGKLYPKYYQTQKFFDNPALAGGSYFETVKYLAKNFDNLSKLADRDQFAVDTKSQVPKGFSIVGGEGSYGGKLVNGEWVKDDSYSVAKGRMIIKSGFATQEEALAWLKEGVAKKKGKTRFIPQQLLEVHRKGADYRDGKSVNGQDYIDTFGFKGGEFGNWMSAKDRQVSLDYGFDALKDLADALGIEDTDISFGGNLNIAFGARGQGLSGGVAHYENARKVINLTKMKGAGSLAHEWFHALDDFIGGYTNDFATNNYRSLPEKTKEAIRDLITVMQYKDATQEETDLARQKRYEQAVRSVKYQLENLFKWVEKVENGTLTDADTRYFKRKPTKADAEKYRNLYDSLIETGDNKYIKELSALRKEVYGHVISAEDTINLEMRLFPLKPENKNNIQVGRKRTDFYTGSQKFGQLHSKDGDYWDSTVEMSARAFACYVADKTNKQNDYLSAHSDSAVTLTTDKDDNPVVVRAYPVGEERTAINKAFDNLIEALKSDGFLHKKTPNANKPKIIQYSINEESENFENEQTGEDLLSDNTKRTIDASTRKQVSGLSETDRKRTSEEIRNKGQSEQQVIGEVTLEVVKEEALNDDMKTIKERNKVKGLNTHFFLGNGFIKGDPNLTVDGLIDGNDVYLRYDGKFAPQVLNRHELVHDAWETPKVQAVADEIWNSLSKAEQNAIFKQERYKNYAEMYKGDMERVKQEFIADVLAGMTSYTKRFADAIMNYWNNTETIDNFKVSEYTHSTDAGGLAYAVGDPKWHTGFPKYVVNELEQRVEKDARTSTRFITETANWYTTRINGVEYFVIYSTEESKPTILYASKGKQAEYERIVLKSILEDYHNGRSNDGTSTLADQVFSIDWVRVRDSVQNTIQRVGRNGNDRNASVLQGKSKRKPRRAFEDVIENLFEISDRGNGRGFSLSLADGRFNLNDYTIDDILKWTPEQFIEAYEALGLDDEFSADDFELDDISIEDVSEKLHTEPKKIEILVRRGGLGSSYVDENHTAVMTQKRIAEAIKDSGARFHSDYAQKYITRISPKDFIDLTVTQKNMDRDSFDSNVEGDHGSKMGEYDYESALLNNESPKLSIDRTTGQIIGHNGRHRMRALEMSGVESVEIEVEFYDEDGHLIKYNAETIPNMAISSQFDTAIETHISNIIPLNEAHRDEIERSYGEKAHSNAKVKYSASTDESVDTDTLSKEWDEALEKYGAIQKGETPTRDIDVPKKRSKNEPVSQFARTALEAGITPNEVIDDFQREVMFGKMAHEVITDKKAEQDAIKTIEKLGFAEAINNWNVLVEEGKIGKNDFVFGMVLYNQAITNKDYKLAMKLISDLCIEATNSAQVLQSIRMLKKMSPDGTLYYLEKSVEKMNEEFIEQLGDKFKKIEIDPDLMKELYEAKTEEERNKALEKIEQNIANQIPSTKMDKWNSWRYLAMLGNLRTHERNIFGNATFWATRKIKNLVGAVLEKTISSDKRTKSVKKTKEAVKFAKKDAEVMKDILTGTGGKYEIANKIQQKRKIFKTRWLEYLRRKNYDFLEAEDWWFLRSAYQDSMAQLITARKIDVSQLEKGTKEANDLLNKIRAYAINEAKVATFRQASDLGNAINRIKKDFTKSESLGKRTTGILLEGLMPFTNVPINIAKQGVAYSPLGLIKGIYDVCINVKKGNKTASEAIDLLSKGLTGTAIMALGVLLRAMGILVAEADDDDKKKEHDKMNGKQSYALQIGDHSFTLDWMNPSSMPLFIGVELYDLTSDGSTSAEDIINSLSRIGDPMIELSVLQGVSDALSNAKYTEENPMIAVPIGMLTSYIGQAFPTLGGQIARLIDDNQRTVYTDKGEGFFTGQLSKFIQTTAKKIPFASMLLEPQINAWGEEKTYGNVVERIAESTISPGYYSKITSTEVDDELNRLFEATGDNSVYPTSKTVKSITVKKKEYKLNASQSTEYARERGQRSLKYVTELMNKIGYKNLPEEKKVKRIKEAYEKAQEEAKDAIFEKYFKE